MIVYEAHKKKRERNYKKKNNAGRLSFYCLYYTHFLHIFSRNCKLENMLNKLLSAKAGFALTHLLQNNQITFCHIDESSKSLEFYLSGSG